MKLTEYDKIPIGRLHKKAKKTKATKGVIARDYNEMSRAQMIRQANKSESTVLRNMVKRGMTFAEALRAAPLRGDGKGGVQVHMSIRDLCRMTGTPESTFRLRRRQGLSFRECLLGRRTLYTYNGQTRTLSGWSQHTGIAYRTLWKRLATHGWSIERALTENPCR